MTLVDFHHIEFPPPWTQHKLNITKKKFFSLNGLKMILAKFHHFDLWTTRFLGVAFLLISNMWW